MRETSLTQGGVRYEDVSCGDGAEAGRGVVLTVHYTGRLRDGTVFDTSRGGDPFTFPLGAGQVIAGWEEGLPGLRVGARRRLEIPPQLAFGDGGFGELVGPGETVVFEVDLLRVAPRQD